MPWRSACQAKLTRIHDRRIERFPLLAMAALLGSGFLRDGLHHDRDTLDGVATIVMEPARGTVNRLQYKLVAVVNGEHVGDVERVDLELARHIDRRAAGPVALALG